MRSARRGIGATLAIVATGLVAAAGAQAQAPAFPAIPESPVPLPDAPLPPLPSLDGRFEQETLAYGPDNAGEPIGLAVLPNGDALHTSRDGRVFYTSKQGETDVAARLPVYTHDEDGLQAVAVDPNFAQNGWIYLYYAPKLDTPADDPNTPGLNEGDAPTSGTEADFAPYKGWQYLSRFKLNGRTLDLASEQLILKVPADRGICCHVGGDIDFDAQGNLYLSTGDDTNPFESDLYTPIDERPTRNPGYDAQRTSANTNDLRGKVLRIRVQDDGTYTVPEGNLFGPGGKHPDADPTKTRREIFAMGFRNPFRMSVDKRTGWVYLGEYGPDAQTADPNRGPQGVVEFNQIRGPGNYGWPYCTGPNGEEFSYVDYDFETRASGARFDCTAPVNESPRNTGLRELPPAEPAWIWYDGGTVHYNGKATNEFENGGEAPMGGPVYDFDPGLASDVKFPESYDGQWFVGDWTRGWIKSIEIGAAGEPTAIHPFFDTATIAAVIDMAFGPDGSLYVLDYGSGSYSGRSPDAALYKINHVSGNRAPVARIEASPDNGPAPLTVQFSSEGSGDPDGEAITYAWDFDGDGTTDSTEQSPGHVYTQAGNYTARLTVTDAGGKSGSAAKRITVGNTRPAVELELPESGLIFDHGDRVQYKVTVTDPEDGPVDCGRVVLQTALGHNEHAHGDQTSTGCSGSFVIPPAWEGDDQYTFYVVGVSYTDNGGAGGAEPLTAEDEAILQPRDRQAEHFTTSSGVVVEERPVPEGGGGRAVGQVGDGDHVGYDGINLRDIDRLDVRVAPAIGGTIEARLDAPDGELAGSVDVPGSGGAGEGEWTTVALPLTAPTGPHELFLVFENPLVPPVPGLPASMFSVDLVRFVGRGVNAAPQATASGEPTSGRAPLTVRFTGDGTDGDGDALSYSWDFGVPGTDGDTAEGREASYTYTTPGTYTARLTVSDGHGGTGTATVEVVVEEEPGDTTAPAITDPTPAPGATTTDKQPTIGATVTDDGGAVGRDGLALYLDGVQVTTFAYDAATGRLTYTPPRKLAKGEHSVRVVATDAAGNRADRAWAFRVR